MHPMRHHKFSLWRAVFSRRAMRILCNISVAILFLALVCGGGMLWFVLVKPQPLYAKGQNFFAPPDLAVNPNLPPGLMFDRLVIDKPTRRLTAYANGRQVRVYIVALSKKPVGHKVYEGDRKTPEGLYFVDTKNPYSKYHKNLGVSYPNEADTKRAAALGKSPGGQIKIHGLGPKEKKRGRYHWLRDWSHGCIVITDAEIDELYDRTPVGTPIELRP